MKKILVSVFLLVFGLCLVGCVDTPNGPGSEDPYPNGKYKLTVIDDFGYLVKPLDKYYKVGEEVEVHLAFLSGPRVGININGEYIGENAETKHTDGHPVITFIMPDKDSILYTTCNGYILKNCGEDNHQWDEGREIEGGNGGYVMKYICELCGKTKEEIITIIMPELKIFYSLQEAFNNQFLTHEDLEEIANCKNNVNYEDLPKMDIMIEDKIKEDFCSMNDINYGLDTEIPGTIRFFGKYDKGLGYIFYIVMIDNIFDYQDVIGQEVVDGITFNYDTTQRILVWREHE